MADIKGGAGMPDEEEVKLHFAKNARKLVPVFIKIFNRMDMRCKQLAMSKPARPMTDYCQKCQEMFKEVYGGKTE